MDDWLATLPITLLKFHKQPEVLYHTSIDSLNLSISLNENLSKTSYCIFNACSMVRRTLKSSMDMYVIASKKPLGKYGSECYWWLQCRLSTIMYSVRVMQSRTLTWLELSTYITIFSNHLWETYWRNKLPWSFNQNDSHAFLHVAFLFAFDHPSISFYYCFTISVAFAIYSSCTHLFSILSQPSQFTSYF